MVLRLQQDEIFALAGLLFILGQDTKKRRPTQRDCYWYVVSLL